MEVLKFTDDMSDDRIIMSSSNKKELNKKNVSGESSGRELVFKFDEKNPTTKV